MAGTLQYASHANFSIGMVRDVPRHLIPEGAVYDAENIVITNSGSLAKRGACTSALASATNAAPTEIGAQSSANTDNTSFLYTAEIATGGFVRAGSMPFSSVPQNLNTFTTSFAGQSVSAPTIYGDSIAFGVRGTGVLAWCGGANLSSPQAEYSASGLTITTAIGNNTINIGATAASFARVGGYIHLSNGGTNEYTGRIVSVSSPSIVVDPAPIYAVTYTSINYYPILGQVGTRNDNDWLAYVGCAGTFVSGGDSRIVVGNIRTTNATGTTTAYPSRIMWSVREASDATVTNCDGLVQATRAGFPRLNYIDIDDIGQIIALVPIGSSNMLIFGTENTVLLSGQLLTQQAAQTNVSIGRGGLTASIRAFPQKVGCISPKSIQRTSVGVMFASRDGVYVTDGSSMRNVMDSKISNYWGDVVVESSSSTDAVFRFGTSTFSGPDGFAAEDSVVAVLGSANINDSHYYISLATGGLLCDLRAKFGWTRIPANQIAIASSCADADQTTNRVYAAKDNLDAATSSYDRIIRLDPVVLPEQSTTDADGTQFEASIVTRAYAEGDPAQRRRYRHTLATYKLVRGVSLYPSSGLYPSALLFPGGSNGAFTVSATKGLNSEGTTNVIGSTTGGSEVSTVSRYDHQTINPAITYTITTSGAPPGFELYEITNAFNQLRPGRVV